MWPLASSHSQVNTQFREPRGLMLHAKSSPAMLRGYSSLIHILPKNRVQIWWTTTQCWLSLPFTNKKSLCWSGQSFLLPAAVNSSHLRNCSVFSSDAAELEPTPCPGRGVWRWFPPSPGKPIFMSGNNTPPVVYRQAGVWRSADCWVFHFDISVFLMACQLLITATSSRLGAQVSE